ncbi:MAG: hypothetical protein ACLFRV_05895 [Acidimicrobiales bacterium]
MPKPTPPPTTRHGHLHATGSPRGLPVGPAGLPVHTDRTEARRAGGLGSGGAAAPALAGAVASSPMSIRRLDAGRLTASSLLAHLGWEPGQALVARLGGPGRILVAATSTCERTQTGARSQIHIDAKSQLAIPASLRAWLQVDRDAQVFVRVRRAGSGERLEVCNPVVVEHALDALDGHDTSAGDSGDGEVIDLFAEPGT